MKIVFLIAPFLLIASICSAEAVPVGNAMKAIPAVKEGFMYDWKQNRVVNLATFEIAKRGDVSFEGGYLGTDGVVGVVSYNIGGFRKLGIDMPILNYIDLNLGVGAGIKTITLPARYEDPKGDNRFVFGVTATLINVKF